MNTIDSKLAQFGPPPAEICLDWAWELRSLTGTAAKKSDEVPPSEARQLTWSDMRIDQSGKLHPVVRCSKHFRVDKLLMDIADWLEAQEAERQDIERFLEKRTRAVLSHDSKKAAAGMNPANDLAKSDTALRHFSSQTATNSRFSSKRNMFAPDRLRMILVGGPLLFAGAVLIPLIWGYLQPTSQGEHTAVGLYRADTPLEPDSPSVLVSPSEQAGQAGGNQPDEYAAIKLLQAETVAEPQVDDVSSERSLAEVFQWQGSFDESETASVFSESVENKLAQPSIASAPDRPNAVSLAKEQAEPREDVQQSLEQASQIDAVHTIQQSAADHKAGVHIPSTPRETESSEPLSIPTIPQRQVQKLPRRTGLRASEPSWRFRLTPAEGFNVEPEGIQTTEQRSLAEWVLRAEDAEDLETAILIQVKQLGQGGTTLEWNVAAIGDELPQVRLPLDQAYLDEIQVHLSRFQVQLSSAIGYAQSLTKISGMPSEAKSLLAARRKGFEAEAELVSRLMKTVSEAQQLNGWLDGQLEIHAEFFDATQPDSPPKISFGVLTPDTERDRAMDEVSPPE